MPKLIESELLEVREKPREKILHYGPESLDDAELLSVILGTGYKGMDVHSLSKYILAQFGSRGIFSFQSFDEIRSKTGLPFVKSCVLLAIGEYMRRINKKDNVQIKSSEQFYEYIKSDFTKNTSEQLRIVCLDSRRRVLHSGLIAQGEANTLAVTLSSVFHHPIRLNTRNFYLAHNHPNGLFDPSGHDIDFTLRVNDEAKKFGLSFDDHIIVNEEGFYSFALGGVL